MAHDERTAEQVGRNATIFRAANEGIREAANTHGVREHVPFICECADQQCCVIVRLSLREYEAVRSASDRFLNAPGHDAAAGAHARLVEQHASYGIVQKVGRAGEVAVERDPRRTGVNAPDPLEGV